MALSSGFAWASAGWELAAGALSCCAEGGTDCALFEGCRELQPVESSAEQHRTLNHTQLPFMIEDSPVTTKPDSTALASPSSMRENPHPKPDSWSREDLLPALGG